MEIKISLPLLPLRDIVVFPNMVIPLFVGRDKSISALNEVMKKDKKIILVTQKNSEIDDPKKTDVFMYGCEGSILQLLKLPDGTVKVLVEGLRRVKILDYKEKDPYYRAVVQRVSNKSSKDSVELDALANNLRQVFAELIQIAPNLSEEHTGMLSNIQKPARLADRAVSLLTVSNPEKQDIL